MIAATSQASGQQALVDGLNTLEGTLGDPQDDRSPGALIGALNDALQLYSANPGDLSAQHWKVAALYYRVFWKTLVQILGKPLSPIRIPSKC